MPCTFLTHLLLSSHIKKRKTKEIILSGFKASFQAGGAKLERFLPKNQHTQRKLLDFEN